MDLVMTTYRTGEARAPLKDRRGWLIAFGIFEILIAVLCLLIVILVVAVLCLPQPGGSNPAQANQVSPAVGMFGALLVYGTTAAAFLTIGIGSIRCRNWARIAMLMLSGFCLVTGIFSTSSVLLVMPTVMRQQGATNPAAQQGVYLGLIVFMTVIMIVLPVIFLVFYSCKSVKATCLSRTKTRVSDALTPPITAFAKQFAARETNAAIQQMASNGTQAATKVPVPLIILAVLQGCGVLAPIGLLVVKSVFVFGIFLHGPSAIPYVLALSALSAYSAWSTLHQKLIGWEIGLYVAIFGIASFVTTFIGHDLMQVYRQMGLNEDHLRIFAHVPQLASIIWITTLVSFTVYFALLVYTRKFFSDHGRPEPETSAWHP
jgi:hypothetical protein